jgi:hypothetical protein
MVRQLFQTGVLQSAFWHQFAMTAHSPVGMNPEHFKVKKAKEVSITFADNDVEHIDETGTAHDEFSFGLKKSLFNYMQGIGLEEPLHKWFDKKVPKTTMAPDYILNIVAEEELPLNKPNAKIVFTGKLLSTEVITKSKKGSSWELLQLNFVTNKETISLQVDKEKGEWLAQLLPQLSLHTFPVTILQQVKESYEANGWDDFELFFDNKPVGQLWKAGLLRL